MSGVRPRPWPQGTVPLHGCTTRSGRLAARRGAFGPCQGSDPGRGRRGRLPRTSEGRFPGPRDGRRLAPLLDLDAGAGFLELRLDRLGLLAGDALLDGVRGSVDEVLGLLEAQARDGADDLDHLDLLVAGARENDVELGLLLNRSAVAGGGRGGAGSGDRDRSGGGDAPLLLDLLLELDQVENGHLPELVEHLVDSGGSHYSSSLLSSVISEEHTSELQSLAYLVCRLLLEKKKILKSSSSIRTLSSCITIGASGSGPLISFLTTASACVTSSSPFSSARLLDPDSSPRSAGE